MSANEGNSQSALVVDEQPIVQQAMKILLPARSEIRSVSCADDPIDAINIIERDFPALIISELEFSAGNGFEFLKIVRERFPAIRSLVFSGLSESTCAMRCVQLGARGYVMKTSPIETVLDAIRSVSCGGIYLSQNILAFQETDEAQIRAIAGPIAILSPCEYEVYRLVGKGFSSKQIAMSSHRSVRTVDTYKARIKRKLGLPSMMELARHAFIQNGQ